MSRRLIGRWARRVHLSLSVILVGCGVAAVQPVPDRAVPPGPLCHPGDSEESTWRRDPAYPPRLESSLIDFDTHGDCGDLDVWSTVETRWRSLQYCVERWMRDEPAGRRYLEARWTVRPDGSAQVAQISLDLPQSVKIAGCIERQLARWQFGPPIPDTGRGDPPTSTVGAPASPLAPELGRSPTPACEVAATLQFSTHPREGWCERHHKQIFGHAALPDSGPSRPDHLAPWSDPSTVILGPDGRRALPAGPPQPHHFRGSRFGPSHVRPILMPSPLLPACFATPRTLANAVVDALHQGDLDAFEALFVEQWELAHHTQASPVRVAGKWVYPTPPLEVPTLPTCDHDTRVGTFSALRTGLQQVGAGRPEVLALRPSHHSSGVPSPDQPPVASGVPPHDLEATLDLDGAPLVLVMEGVFEADRGYVLSGVRLHTDAHSLPE